MQVTYVRTSGGYEVDFLARGPGQAPELIQVCADLTNAETSSRELRAMADAADAYPGATRRVLTLPRDSMPVEAPQGVIVQPAYEWLLATEIT